MTCLSLVGWKTIGILSFKKRKPRNARMNSNLDKIFALHISSALTLVRQLIKVIGMNSIFLDI